MEFDKQIKLGHLLLADRRCRICGETKNLIEDFYRTRKNRGPVASSYSYECKECAKLRIKKHYSENDLLGTCCICDSHDIKVSKGICKKCNNGLKQFGYNIDTLRKSVLYLEDTTPTGTSKK